MGSNLLTVTILLILLLSCQQQIKKEDSSINGVWNSVGSGWILKIEDSTAYDMYDITSISCLPDRKGNFEELKNALTLKNDTLKLKKGVITYKFIRGNRLPELCLNPSKNKNNDPLYNIEVFVETVKEHYAFFEINDLEWDTIYQLQKRSSL